MILGQISYLDCLAFVIFLGPQLLIHVNVLELIPFVLQALPFLGEQASFPLSRIATTVLLKCSDSFD